MSIKADVDRGLEIVAEVAKLQAEFKLINERLREAGYVANKEGKVEALKDADRDGRRWLAKGSTHIVPVIFTADTLVGSFASGSELHTKINEAANGYLRDFFKPVSKFENRFEDGKIFRKAAHELLEDKAPAFITACIARDKDGVPKSKVAIAWDKPEVLP